jgi:GNAT superfamily N-acetyltransferase
VTVRWQVRAATAADAAALAEFAARAFADAYGPSNDPADTALHVARTYGERQQAAEIATAHCLLAVDDGAIVGYALVCVGSAHADIATPAPSEVRRFYVDQNYHGQGVASALMEAAASHSRAAGAEALWLTVWEESPRARAFYAKAGFRDVGSTSFLLGGSAQTDRLLVRRLR